MFDWILLILSCKKNKYYSLDEFEFPPDQTTDYGVSCPCELKHQCLHFFSVGIDPILFKVGGYIDNHNILHEFEFWPNGTTDYGVSCPDRSQVFSLSVMIQISCALWLCKMLNLTVTFCYLWLTENFDSRHSPPPPRAPFKTLITLLPVTFSQLDLQLGVG